MSAAQVEPKRRVWCKVGKVIDLPPGVVRITAVKITGGKVLLGIESVETVATK